MTEVTGAPTLLHLAGIGMYGLVSALNYKIFLDMPFIYMAGIVGLILTMPFKS